MATVTQIDATTLEFQDYNTNDEALISTFDINTSLDENSNIELAIFDLNKNLIDVVPNYLGYTTPPSLDNSSPEEVSLLTVNPENDLINAGYSRGEYLISYNFFQN